jgi:hypothetical protein
MDPAAFLPSAPRIQQMREGTALLKVWLEDIIYAGILHFDFSEENMQEIASRMVDAKLGGVAKRLRLLGTLDRSATSWPKKILSELADLYLISLYFMKWPELSLKFQQSLVSFCGFSVRSDAILLRKGIKDIWYVLGQSMISEEKLQVRKTWLAGYRSSRFALLLDFTFGRTPFKTNWKIGQSYQGEIKYFPGIMPLRAILHQASPVRPLKCGLASYSSLDAFFLQYAKALNKNPLIRSFPCSLRNVYFQIGNNQVFIIDQDNHFVKTNCEENAAWEIFALAGGHPINVFGEWDGGRLHLLSYNQAGRYFPVHSDLSTSK